MCGVGFGAEAVSKSREIVEKVTKSRGPWWEYPANSRDDSLWLVVTVEEPSLATVSLHSSDWREDAMDVGEVVSITYESGSDRKKARMFVRMKQMGEMTFVVTA